MPAERIHVYEMAEPADFGGPGLAFRARVAEAGGPLAVGAEVLFRSVGAHEAGGEEGIDRLLGVHAVLRGIASPHVVAPADFGVLHGPEGRRFWCASPWPSGRSLAAIAAGVEVVPDILTEAVANGIATALVDLHEAGVFGMGVSPSTILVRDDTSVALLEPGFGAARSAGWPRDGKAPEAMLCAAPETIERVNAVDSRSDLFATGAVLFRCMTGRWHRPDDARALRARCGEMPGGRPSDERPRASLFLSEVVNALLHPERDRRPATAHQLRTILAERRHGEWWKTLHIDQETRSDGPVAKSVKRDAPPPALPAPSAPPSPDWFAERLEASAAIERHALPCVGREEEILRIVREARSIPQGGGRTLLLAGDAGMGKTRILDAAIERLRQGGDARPIVLHGTHRRAGVGRPLGAVTEALTRFVSGDRTVEEQDVAALLGPASSIVHAFTALLSGEEPRTGRPLALPVIHGAFVQCLRTLSSRAPVVLVIENLQWADREAIDLFAHLARVAPQFPLLLVASLRPPAQGTALALALPEIQTGSSVGTLLLSPLNGSAVGEMVRSVVEPSAVASELASRIHRAVGGVPGAILHALRVLENERALRRDQNDRLQAMPELAKAAVPTTPTDAAIRVLSACSGDERRLALAAAVQGAAFDAEVARIACGMDLRSAHRTLAGLEALGVITPGGVARRFTSHILHDLVHGGADAESLRALHEATASAFLESRNPLQLPPSQVHGIVSYRVAWHYLKAGRAARGLLYAPVALSHVEGTLRLGDADRLTDLACRALESDPSRQGEYCDMLAERARVLGACGCLDEQRIVLDRAVPIARERKDFGREARVLAMSARNRTACGDAERAADEASLAAAAARRSGSAALEHAALLVQCEADVRIGRASDARARLLEALESARSRGDAATELDLAAMLAGVQWTLGAADSAEEAAARALQLARAAGDFGRESEALVVTGNCAVSAGDLVRAEGCFRRALQVLSCLGDAAGEARVLGHLAMVLQESGSLLEARDAHRSCVERALSLGARPQEVVTRLNLATSEFYLGRLDEARDEYGKALRGARALADVRLQGYALTGLGDVARQFGEWDAARDLLSRATAQFRRTQDPGGLAAALVATARAEAFGGDAQLASAAASEALRLGEQQNARQLCAIAEALLALLDARRGDADAAGRRMAESNFALDGIRADSAAVMELHFLHSLVLRVLRRPTEADRIVLVAAATLADAYRGLPDADRERLVAALSPHREIVAGAERARANQAARGNREGTKTVALAPAVAAPV
ncbi:MAG: hypothetical protein HMLKMBBP_03962 [Planctomycetes bacterium]|nr:hypothetical protein [Planctomycetota bacterium]